MIKVQREDFDVGREIAALSDGNHAVGGLAVFIGLVRDMAGDQPVGAMTLEHYPGMTEKMLARIFPGTRRCGYYEFLTFERYLLKDPDHVATTHNP